MCDRCRPSCYSTRAVYATVLTLVAFAAMPAAAAAQAPDPSTAMATDVSATRLFFAPTGRSLPAGKGYTTLEIKANLVRPITLQTGPIRASAKIVHMGRQTATAEGRIEDSQRKLYAHGTTTCIILGA